MRPARPPADASAVRRRGEAAAGRAITPGGRSETDMLYELTVAVVGMVLPVLLWAAFDALGRRARSVRGEGEERCRTEGVRCLGCYLTGQCASRMRRSP